MLYKLGLIDGTPEHKGVEEASGPGLAKRRDAGELPPAKRPPDSLVGDRLQAPAWVHPTRGGPGRRPDPDEP
jgi:hypothetical protein